MLHLAVALDGPPRFDPGHFTELARLAEHGALDFVTLGDSFARPGPDALAVLSHVAPATRRIGLVPTVTTTHTEPGRVATALATLDWVSRGRAGWCVGVSATHAEAALFGRRPAAPTAALWQRAEEVAAAAARHWDGPAQDASPATAPRPPRPPQGRPVTVVDVTGTGQDGLRCAARHADVVLVRAPSAERAAALRTRVRHEATAYGRDPDDLRVLLSLVVDLGERESAREPGLLDAAPSLAAHGSYYSGGPVDLAGLLARWHDAGAVDGFHLAPIAPHRDLERIVNGTVALLQHRSLFRTFHPGGTLREHLGLPRPVGGRPAADRPVAPQRSAS
ncbi:LLM class flavin-dependent oxidoreductase [Streptomyces sp. NPDC047315]|uniref:LLM class flavin-dependent oxidoreductase n=1 Tax=Streptomyces sp. NPDC047315 TaxID=3155142 RepID=UPI0033D58F59